MDTNQNANQLEFVSLDNFIGVWDNVFDQQFCVGLKIISILLLTFLTGIILMFRISK
jgi:hypothetical protein